MTCHNRRSALRRDRIARFRREIARGAFRVDGLRVAERLIAEILRRPPA